MEVGACRLRVTGGIAVGAGMGTGIVGADVARGIAAAAGARRPWRQVQRQIGAQVADHCRIDAVCRVNVGEGMHQEGVAAAFHADAVGGGDGAQVIRQGAHRLQRQHLAVSGRRHAADRR